MDNLQLQEEVQALQKLRDNYAENLRIFGLDMCDLLPEDISALLDEAVKLQVATNLHELNENYLQEYYFTKKKELIENTLTIFTLQADIDTLNEQFEQEQKQCDVLERFITATKKNALSDGEMEHNKIMLETKIQGLQDKQKSLKLSPKDLNVDELVRKVRLLESSRKQKEKP